MHFGDFTFIASTRSELFDKTGNFINSFLNHSNVFSSRFFGVFWRNSRTFHWIFYSINSGVYLPLHRPSFYKFEQIQEGQENCDDSSPERYKKQYSWCHRHWLAARETSWYKYFIKLPAPKLCQLSTEPATAIELCQLLLNYLNCFEVTNMLFSNECLHVLTF